MYWLGLPGLLSVSQPGPTTRFGGSLVSSSFVPRGSPPRIGVNGWPLAPLKMPPNCQPLRAHPVNRGAVFGAGASQVRLTTTFCPTLKSDRPREVCWSKNNGFMSPLGKASSATVAESVSMLLLQVYAPWNSTPWLKLLVTTACSA